ncbi:MAG TPA: acyclic terpene utilization AtuA family protein [Burkholderiales bacterium]|nr:acyclic terpene utilization AtuA family protein [Burkholderiales bacterium]
MPASSPNRDRIRIGCGAGYAGDRWEPALECVERGNIDYLVYETLAERTIALGQLEKLRDPARGYNPMLEARLALVLKPALERGVRIVSNMGAANPLAAGVAVLRVARELGIAKLKVAIVLGDDVTDIVRDLNVTLMENGEPLESIKPLMVSANAYLGADAVAAGLATGAEVVITGRVADPSLFVGCMLDGLHWRDDDYSKLGQATVAGHLMECAGQITGGYFADPGFKDVAGLARLGFPICEMTALGEAFITKPEGSGGAVTLSTCKEQLLYEVHDPACYVTPDCVADFSGVRFSESARDQVSFQGGRAASRTPTYKVSVGYRAGYVGEGHMAYAGPGALARAKLAGDIVRERLALRRIPLEELRVDLIGHTALHGDASQSAVEPYEVRLRVAGRATNRADAAAVGEEVQTLYTNGPYGGASDFMQIKEVVGVRSILLERSRVKTEVKVLSL